MTKLTRRTMLAGATAATAANLAALAPPTAAMAQTAAPKQAPGFYRSKLGDYELVVLSDGGTTSKIETSPSRSAKLEDVKEVLSRMFVSTDEWRVPYNIDLRRYRLKAHLDRYRQWKRGAVRQSACCRQILPPPASTRNRSISC